MQNYKNERLLIISNNVLSTTRNNGKTVYSYIDSLPKENVAQFYFYNEQPSIEGYSYYRIIDKDIIKGMFSPKKRGNVLCPTTETASASAMPVSPRITTSFFRILREILWYKKWKSPKLVEWLDSFSPTAVFFVAGDAGFAYDIYKFVCRRYNPKASLYITDDYVTPRSKESFCEKIKRKFIRRKLTEALTITDTFFTVSRPMKDKYLEDFGRDSKTIVNFSESLKENVEKIPDDRTVLLYAGSLYYGREQVIGKIASAIEKYNNKSPQKKAVLNVYTNVEPDETTKKLFVIDGCGEYCGSLNKEELKIALNRADILLFAESFDEEQIEKTKYSLSTKVTEYLSVGKPILAVGPQNIGSMEHLADVSLCINDMESLEEKLFTLLDNASMREELSEKALEKYEKCHNREMLQTQFISDLFKF